MSTGPELPVPAPVGFPLVRRGYDPAAVDEHLRAVRAELTELRRRVETGDAVPARVPVSAPQESEQLLAAARSTAEQIVDRARQQAATIDERARQEFAWRRRQLRHEQNRLTRHHRALLSQLTWLRVLATERAGWSETGPRRTGARPDED